jgi:hypothetical protein
VIPQHRKLLQVANDQNALHPGSVIEHAQGPCYL